MKPLVSTRDWNKIRQRLSLVLGLSFLLAAVASPAPPHARAQAPQGEGRVYPQTGHLLASQFVPFFDSHGGLALFGYPITDAAMEGGYLVQWTERERLEWHPENAGTPFEVQLGLLGSELTHGLNGPHFAASNLLSGMSLGTESVQQGEILFPETGQSVGEPFLTFWRQNGGLGVFGYPISARYTDESGMDVQWFQRARFEYHPELPDEFEVTLGLVGHEALNLDGLPRYEVQFAEPATGGSTVQIGLSQGGESPDPSFFDNIREVGSDLGPALVRLDNIYNFYDVVQKSSAGTITYNWARLDRVIDAIRAMGKQPFLCLSYMPEVFSKSGVSHVQPPADYSQWSALVRATVQHLNVDRRLNIRYWEVWNEPNQLDFWRGSFQDYLKLYDATVAAATSVDPKIMIGGPAFSIFEAWGMEQLLDHEAQLPGGRVDFLSWHAYGADPDRLAGEIRSVRGIAARYPSLHPQLFLTEFNVLQGGPGDTSANGYTDKAMGAIQMLRSIESMNRERLDQAFLFELKDGQGPRDYWGRWGVVTNSGEPKPIYYALQAYLNHPQGSIPALVTKGPTDGSIGLMGFGGSNAATIFLWYTGQDPARIKLRLPDSFSRSEFSAALFDDTHNNPAKYGPGPLEQQAGLDPGDLLFTMTPDSLIILTANGR